MSDELKLAADECHLQSERWIKANGTPEIGASRQEGRYYCNLRKREIRKKVANDRDDNPNHGYKIHKDYWNNAIKKSESDYPNHPSVNCCDCTGCRKCSIHLQTGWGDPGPVHVIDFDLEKLNKIIRQNLDEQGDLAAIYLPDGQRVCKTRGICHPGNPCHYELQSKTTTRTLRTLKAELTDIWGIIKPNEMDKLEQTKNLVDAAAKIYPNVLAPTG